ncbi:MAG: hypothetical protein ACI4MN_04095 [Candidatus Coproplasma sp.]
MTIRKTVANFITSITAIVVILLCSVANSFVFAAETGNIMQDLSTLTVDGKAFNVEDYPADAEGTPQILTLYEQGYSFYINSQTDYSLYVYLYNPSQINIKDDTRNTIQFYYETDSEKYTLKLIELSEDKLFCKFKVNFTDEEKTNHLAKLNRESRVYDISTIEIYEGGVNATSYPIERKFIYTGFSKGYGQVDDESTLSGTLTYTEEGGTETKHLDVHHTTWRPEGTSQNGDKYTQDSIHSVYFAVKNDVAVQYDYLNSVKCEWLEAYTAPIFVTGNSEIYKAVNDLITFQSVINTDPLNKAPEEFDFSNFNYAIAGGYEVINQIQTMDDYYCTLTVNMAYANDGNINNYVYLLMKDGGKELKTLFWNMFAGQIENGNFIDNYDVEHYTVSSGEVAYYAKNVHPFYNDNKVAGKYPSYLFESWETEKHTEIIPVGKEYTLTSQEIKQDFWEKVFGGSHIENKEDFKASAIEEVKSLTDDKAIDCARYYISEQDYEEFSNFYKANKDDSIIYLLRFAVSEYTAMQAMIVGEANSWLVGPHKEGIANNAFFAQTNTYLDFDIIDLEYVKDGKSYVLPIDMSPIDIFPNLSPPAYWSNPEFWPYGVGIIAGLIAFYVVYIKVGEAIRGRR